jgi:hypothetical protein
VLGLLCQGDSDIDRLSDRNIIVEFDATLIQPYVRFFVVGRFARRCSFMSRGVPQVDVGQVASAQFAGEVADPAIGCQL